MFCRVAVVCFLLSTFALAQPDGELQRLFQLSQDQLLAGDYVLARDGFAKAWKGLKRQLGDTHPRTLDARIFYGQLLTITGAPEEAMTVLGPISSGNTTKAMIARGSFALALRQTGQLSRATKLLRELVRTFSPVSSDDKIHLARMQSELAVSLTLARRFREAETAAKESLRLLDQSDSPPPVHRAAVYTILGQIYLLSHRDAQAQEALFEAKTTAGPFWDVNHPEMAILEGALGMLAFRAGRYDEAERSTRIALAAIEKLLGPDHGEVGALSRHLSQILKKQKRSQESREWATRARRIVDKANANQTVSAWSFREVK